MTSADFGPAYLNDGWAARFVGRLFADFSVLFVGYSLNDPVRRYMTDAFAAEALAARRKSTRTPAYIFVSYQGKAAPPGALENWRLRGLEPIFYHYGRHHRLLRETIVAWAAARDDWLSSTATLIALLAGSPPQSLTPSWPTCFGLCPGARRTTATELGCGTGAKRPYRLASDIREV